MDLKTAIKTYRNTSGPEFRKPDKGKSYQRNDAWNLLSASGELLAVVNPGGECVYGARLQATWSAFAQGLSQPAA